MSDGGHTPLPRPAAIRYCQPSMAVKIQPLPLPERAPRTRRVFVRDLVLAARIGVYRHEKKREQRIRLNLDLTVEESPQPQSDRLADVVCYEKIVNRVRALIEQGHVNLVETLAERIAALCLEDSQVTKAVVRVEKLEVFADAASVGVEIERSRGV